MADVFETLVLKNPSDAEVTAVGLNGWRLVLFKGSDAWFERRTI